VGSLVLPTGSAGGAFDYTGDGVPDNALADAVALFDGGAELVNRTLNDFFSTGQYTYMVEFRDVPTNGCGPLEVVVHTGTSDTDHDGIPDLSDGEVQVVWSSFRDDGFGPMSQLNTAAMDGELILSAPGGTIRVPIVLPDGTSLTAPVDGVRFRATVSLVATAGQPTSLRLLPLNFKNAPIGTNAEIGGYISLQSVVDEVNSKATACACSEIDVEAPVAQLAVEDGAVTAKCIQQPNSSLCPQETYGQVCENLGATCMALQVMSTLADVTSGNFVNAQGEALPDALSIGLYATLTPTALSEPPLAPDFAAVDDLWVANPVCEVLQDSDLKFIGVLLNDFIDTNAAPVIVSVTDPSAGGTVQIASFGDRVQYEPAPGYYGFDDFTYTIQDAAGNTDTASVEIRVSRVVPYDATIDVETLCNLLCEQQRVCDPDAFLEEWGDGAQSACLEACTTHWLPLWDMTSFCAQAQKQEALCQAVLTCPHFDKFNLALPLAENLEAIPELTPCGSSIVNRVARCGTCDAGYYSPECQECPGGASLPCGGNATCLDGSGGDGSCVCNDGYTYNGGECVDIDECLQEPTPCGAGATCSNRVGSYVCGCLDGTTFDGITCVPFVDFCNPNPCLLDAHSPTQTCTLTPEGEAPFTCDCAEDFPWDAVSKMCRSVDDRCNPNPCYLDPLSNGACYDWGVEGYQCECVPFGVNYWNWTEFYCYAPCENNQCSEDPYSTGVCEPDSSIGTPTCICVEGFYFDFSSMMCVSFTEPCLPDRCYLSQNAIANTCTPNADYGYSCECTGNLVWDHFANTCIPLS